MSSNEQEIQSRSFSEIVASDFQKTKIRVAAYGLSRGARAALLSLLRSKKLSKTWVRKIRGLLDTEVGLAIISLVIGWALTCLPMLKEDSRVQLLAEEFRVSGMTLIGTELLDEISRYFIPLMTEALNQIPQESQVRIAITPDSPPFLDEELEESVLSFRPAMTIS